MKILTEEDMINLIAMVKNTTFQGGQAAYIVELLGRLEKQLSEMKNDKPPTPNE